MKNALGNPARGEAFYPRDKEISRIYRILGGGTSIYLEAPRRVGKTSILKFLEEQSHEEYHFIYVITESVDNPNDFFKTIFEEVIQSDVVSKLRKISHAASSFITDLLGRVTNIKGVELKAGEEPDYHILLIDLLEKVEAFKIILMIDEFPQTIQNIFDIHGKDAAQHFIQLNRELRHNKRIEGKINFIYTGSVSLIPLVESITSLTAINDLRSIEIPPLTTDQAIDFLQKLMTRTGFILNEDIIHYMLQKIRWLIPFHLQLLQQEVVDVMEDNNGTIDQAGVDKAFAQVVHVRNKPQFEPYFERLKKIFKAGTYAYAVEILKQIAQKTTMGELEVADLAVRFDVADWQRIISSLIADGYIHLTEKQYRYTSPILQLWCSKYVCDGN